MGLTVTVTEDGRTVRDIKAPTMHAWPLVGVAQSWLNYCLIMFAGLLLTEYTDARASLKESGMSSVSRWRETGTWGSFVVGVGYHAYQVFVVHDLTAVKPLTCALGLLVLWVVRYMAHQIQRALRLIAEIRAKLDTIGAGTTLPDPEPEPPVHSGDAPVVVQLDRRRAEKSKARDGRHRKAA